MDLLASGATRGGGGAMGRQNRAFGVDEMVRNKVFKGTGNFWERRKKFLG